ncbi:MAG: DUF4097 family beta strand repeat-containing protein [Acidobacteriota bacterium]
MRAVTAAIVVVCVSTLAPSNAWAQRFGFERSIPVAAGTTLDVATVRGKIDIVAGPPGRIVVKGVATVRVGVDVPSNAVELAQHVAAAPPIEEAGNVVRLREPTEDAARRAVTISYQVQVPPDTPLVTTSESGATSISGVAASVAVHTQSAAIDLRQLTGIVTVSTGSGAVVANAMTGVMTVTTDSSGFTGNDLRSSLRIRTQSGEVQVAMTGTGDLDVETGSSAIRVHGLRGGLVAKTQSGRVTVEGAPGREWAATTGSSAVNFQFNTGIALSVDAVTRSGSVVVDGGSVAGSVAKRAVKGTINGGGSLVRIGTGSGSIRLQFGPP